MKTLIKKKHFVWIHGLPGSGKSTLASKIKDKNKDKNFIILDDIANFRDVKKELDKGENIILTSPYFENYFKYTDNYNDLKSTLSNKEEYELEEIWFDNDLEGCIDNLKNRKGHKIDSHSI